MKSLPLVTVVLPVYNSEAYVAAAIESVLSQTYSAIELIVVDDKSSDNSVAEVKKAIAAEPSACLIELDKNSGGAGTPRNTGLEAAIGAYVAFIDSDDIWHREKLEKQIDMMLRHGLDFTCTSVCRSLPNLYSTNIDKNELVSEAIIYRRLIRKNFIATSSVVMKTTSLGNHRFSAQAHHVAVEDYLLWLQLHINPEFKSARLIDRLLYYREIDGSLSRNKWEMSKKIWRLQGEIHADSKLKILKRYYYFVSYLLLGLMSVTYE